MILLKYLYLINFNRLHFSQETIVENLGIVSSARNTINVRFTYSVNALFIVPQLGESPWTMDGEVGAPDRIRTYGLCLRRAALYPAELRVLALQRGSNRRLITKALA